MTSTYVPKCINCGRPESEGEGWKRTTASFRMDYFHNVCPEKVCKKSVPDDRNARWIHFHPCGKDGKGQWDGVWLCGIHLNAEKKKAANMDQWQAERSAGHRNEERSKLAIDILAELGIDAGVHYQSHPTRIGRYTGKIVVDPQELFKALGIGVQLPDME